MSVAPFESTIKLTEDEFVSRYEPREQPDGSMIIEFHATRKYPHNYVWSIVEGDATENLYAVPGIRIVNCVGFVICEKPWDDDTIEAVWFEYPDDFEYLDDATDMAYYDGSGI